MAVCARHSAAQDSCQESRVGDEFSARADDQRREIIVAEKPDRKACIFRPFLMAVSLCYRHFNITRIGGGQFPHCSERHTNVPRATTPNRDQSIVDRDERVRALATTGHQQAALAAAGNETRLGRGCRSRRARAGDNGGSDGDSDKAIAKRLIHEAFVPPLLQLRYAPFDVLPNESNSGSLDDRPIASSTRAPASRSAREQAEGRLMDHCAQHRGWHDILVETDRLCLHPGEREAAPSRVAPNHPGNVPTPIAPAEV